MSDVLVLLVFRYPNLKSVRELIYKRGYGKLNKQRIPLTDNTIVEQVCTFFVVLVILCPFMSSVFQGQICEVLLLTFRDLSGSGQIWNYLHGRPDP